MSVFTWIPEYGPSLEITPKVIRATFGDGYEQRTADGINNKARSWTLTFKKIPTEITDIENFLIARGSVESFTWVPPRGSTGVWVCDKWQRGVPDAGYDTISATFREVFGE